MEMMKLLKRGCWPRCKCDAATSREYYTRKVVVKGSKRNTTAFDYGRCDDEVNYSMARGMQSKLQACGQLARSQTKMHAKLCDPQLTREVRWGLGVEALHGTIPLGQWQGRSRHREMLILTFCLLIHFSVLCLILQQTPLWH